MRVRAVLLVFPLVAWGGSGCRSAPKTSPDAGVALTPLTVESARGWWVGPGATGYWIANDAVRIVSGEHAERRLVKSLAPEGTALKIVLDGAPPMILTAREGGLSLRIGDAKPIDVHRASDLEERDLEKRDARSLTANAHACERAVSCCRAAIAKNLGSADECTPLASAKEIGQCVRALEAFARKAREARIELPACATSAAPSP